MAKSRQLATDSVTPGFHERSACPDVVPGDMESDGETLVRQNVVKAKTEPARMVHPRQNEPVGLAGGQKIPHSGATENR